MINRSYVIYVLCFLLMSSSPLLAAGEAKVIEKQVKTASEASAPDTKKKAADDIKEADAAYLIGPGDMLDIAVWKEEALTKTVVVLPDGNIWFPLIGEVHAAGRNLAQLKQDIEKLITPYVPEVTLNVEVRQVNSMLIYVIGRVNNPGRLILNANVNVLQALATAGGLNAFAKKSKIKIFRQEKQATKIFNFDYDDVSEGSHLDQNIILKRGDVIVVP